MVWLRGRTRSPGEILLHRRDVSHEDACMQCEYSAPTTKSSWQLKNTPL